MAARFDISMLGAPELAKTLASLPEQMERKVITRATREAGKYFLTLAKARAPRDEGRLANTMKLRALRRKKHRVGYAIQTGTRAELGIPASATGYYPAHIELGTSDTPANPYFRGTLRGARAALLAILRLEVDNGIERELIRASTPKA